MKKLVLMMLVGVMGMMLLVPSVGSCDPVWKRGPQRTQHVVVRDHGPRYHAPAPVHYRRDVHYVERHDDDRSGQVAVAVLGGIVVGTLLGTVIAQGR